MAGTSQAAPHVAGVAALLVSLGVRGQAAVDRILATATPGPSTTEYGRGIVNARAAVTGLRPSTTGTTGGTGADGTDTGADGSAPTSGGPATAVRLSAPARVRARTLLGRGIAVRCRSPKAGRCRVTLMHAGRRVATGVASVRAGRTATVRVRAVRAARRTLAHRGTALTLRMRADVAGTRRAERRIVLVRR
jgi:hypothetical protein